MSGASARTDVTVDVAVVGAGGAGGVLAVLLAAAGVRVALVEAAPWPKETDGAAPDERGLALARSSVGVLTDAGLWRDLASLATPIEQVHVSREGGFGCLRMSAREIGLDALAHVVSAGRLKARLDEALRALADADALEVFRPARLDALTPSAEAVTLVLADAAAPATVRAKLVVGADGTRSTVAALADLERSVFDYGQTALVAVVRTDPPPERTALERFTRDGPVALLPLADDRRVAVMTETALAADAVRELSDAAFAERIRTRLGGRLRHVEVLGPRRPWPLVRVVARDLYRKRAVLIGNAAHTVHPNGAQGLNLGLRDAAELAARIVDALRAGGDPGAPASLAAYRAARRRDQRLVAQATHLVARASRRSGPAAAALHYALTAGVNHLPPVKQAFMRRAAGRFPGVTPSPGAGRDVVHPDGRRP